MKPFLPIKTILHYSERCVLSGKPCGAKAASVPLFLVEVIVAIIQVVKLVFECVAKAVLLLPAKYSKSIKNLNALLMPYETVLAIKDLSKGVISSLLFGCIKTTHHLNIHRKLPTMASSLLDLSTAKTTVLPSTIIQEIPFMPHLKILKLGNRKFELNGINNLVSVCKNHPNLLELHLPKSVCNESQIKELQVLVSSKKGLKIIDTEGGSFGPIYMNWHEYNILKKNAYEKGMRHTSYEALNFYEKDFHEPPKTILDFGAGTGQDTIPILRLLPNASITAIDGDEEALTILKSHLSADEVKRITSITSKFTNYNVTQPVDLFISSFTWPYRPPHEFDEMWAHTVRSVRKGGYIAGHFFGPFQNERPDPGMTYHSLYEILKLLEKSGFQLIWFKNEPEGSRCDIIGGSGKPAWGDLYHVVAKKI